MVKTKQIGSNDKFMHIQWIAGITSEVQKEAPWVMGPATQIMKGTMSFMAKAQWMLVWHQPNLTKLVNLLILNRVVLVTNIIKGYEINIERSQ